MVRCTPTASAISATVCCRFPSGPVALYMRRTVAACRSFSLGLRPPVRPRARAACRPSRVPSMISSRWNSSIAPRMWKTSRPVGVVVSMCCFRTTRPTPRAQLVGEREQVLERPHRAGQPGDDEHVARAQVGQRLVELGAGGVHARRGGGEDLAASVGGQVVELAVVVLAAGGHPRVPDLGHHAVPVRRAAGADAHPGRGCPSRYPATVMSRVAAMAMTVA